MKKGFTLIELLVVIAVLAVLAAGVMVAINPSKRIKQANDAKIRNDVGQIATALQAYFTTNQSYPTKAQFDTSPYQLVTSGDLKNLPMTPAGAMYTYAVPAGGCLGTAASPCTESSLNATLNDVATDIWCWRSAAGTASEVTAVAGCAP